MESQCGMVCGGVLSVKISSAPPPVQKVQKVMPWQGWVCTVLGGAIWHTQHHATKHVHKHTSASAKCCTTHTYNKKCVSCGFCTHNAPSVSDYTQWCRCFSLDKNVYVRCHAGGRGTHSLSDNKPLRERDDFVGSMDGMFRVATSVLHAFQQNVHTPPPQARTPALPLSVWNQTPCVTS